MNQTQDVSRNPLISIVIVSYNVKEYVFQALLSIKRAVAKIPHEIYVVDNASVDGTPHYLKKHFPDVHLIENKQNLGFGKANNLALEKVSGEYVVLINPDTVVQEDTFQKLLDFFDKTPDADAATSKILNPDGSFSIDCRHAIPTPSIAFWKVTGLSRLFPKSKLFGQYNLTYMDENSSYPVPAISGSFMMIKKSVLDQIGYFDEQFFMYCEDIDLCKRINDAGFKIYYMPDTQIIHYKGESSKYDQMGYIRNFNKSLHIFFQKHYAPKTSLLFQYLISIGIFFRGAFLFFRNLLKDYFPFILDLAILNLVILLSFFVRWELKSGFSWPEYTSQYWIINLISTGIYTLFSLYEELYSKFRFSIHSIIRTNFYTFLSLIILTFFIRKLAFSRMVFLVIFILAPLLMASWRSYLRRKVLTDTRQVGKDIFTKPTVLVGKGRELKQLAEKLKKRKDLEYDIVGWVSSGGRRKRNEKTGVPYLGSAGQLAEIIKIHKIKQVIFTAGELAYEDILKMMTQINGASVDFKMMPSQLDVLIGKSHIEHLNDIPLVEVQYAYNKPLNRLFKRIFDLVLSTLLIIIMLPVIGIQFLVDRKGIGRVKKGRRKLPLRWKEWNGPRAGFMNFFWKLSQVFFGKISFVGAPIRQKGTLKNRYRLKYKQGITGLAQVNGTMVSEKTEMEKYDLFYLKNYTLILDLEILIKSLFNLLKRNR
ncbi:MAG: glycosyltransferase [Calditrichia bacterium]